VLVTVRKGQAEHRVLFDAGTSPDGVVENMRRLVVLTGCGHAGIVNICRYARQLRSQT
jgi:metal-dependent hydrolase (beta-lactamase superfamily II)